MGGISLSVFLYQYIPTLYHFYREVDSEQWNRVDNPEIYAHRYAQLSFTKM